MRKQLLALLICVILFPINVIPSYASLVINEFSTSTSSDWVEIYNPDGEAIDLSQYRLRDLTATNKKDLSGILEPSGFATFDWSNKLNNKGDLIKLVLISDESIIDQTTYGDQGGLDAPSSSQTGGRKEDGGSEWVLFVSSSKGSSNNSSEIYTPPTPTSTPIPTPTKTPKSTKTPKPVKIKTVKSNTGSTTTTSVAKSNVSNSNSPSPNKITSDKITSSAVIVTSSAVLGNSKKNNLEEDDKSPEVVEDTGITYWIYPISGIIFILIAGAILLYKYRDKNDFIKKIFNNH